jgi:hypothetical protein
MASANVIFTEHKRSVQIYDYMVFICGVDVAPYIKNLTITYTDRTSPGSADITLSNPFNQWILTMGNLNGTWRNTSTDRYTEGPKKTIYQKKLLLSQGFKIQGNTSNPNPPPQNPNLSIKNLSPQASSDFQSKYGFGPGSCIFSRFDTIRIYIKNPYDDTSVDRWMPFFTGTIETKPFQTDYVMGASSVSIQAYDIRSTLSGMRVGVNPFVNNTYQLGFQNPENNVREQQAFFDSAAAGFFKDYYPTTDLVRIAQTDNIFAGKSFVDMTSMVLTGRSGWVSPASGEPQSGVGATAGVKTGQGVGYFVPGQVIKYAPALNQKTLVEDTNHQTNLEAWDKICLFGVDDDGDPYNDFLPASECIRIGKDSFWDGNHTPFNGNVHYLIPASGLQVSDMIRTSFDGINNLMSSPDWTNRFQLISQVCQQIDYEWTVTGSGDIIFEFPMYDFLPRDFGSNKSIYIVDKHLERDNISDEGGEVLSALESDAILSPNLVQAGINKSYSDTARALALQQVPRAVSMSNTLAAKYGVRIQHVSFTGVSPGSDNKYTALKILTSIEFGKRLAEMNKLSLDFSFRPFVRPNRPILHQEKNRIGKTTSVRYNFPDNFQTPTISVSLNCVRTPIVNNGNIQYQHVAGGYSMPISYNAIFEDPDKIGNSDASGISTLTFASPDHQ